jgi:hypothetical protein
VELQKKSIQNEALYIINISVLGFRFGLGAEQRAGFIDFQIQKQPSRRIPKQQGFHSERNGYQGTRDFGFWRSNQPHSAVFSEYEQIKGFKKLKAIKVLKIKGNIFKKFLLNKLFDTRVWESENGYKDMVIEFDGCAYIIMHIGGFYKEKELAKHIKITSLQ